MNNRLVSLALLGLPLALVACDTAGERADTGECPAGEVCSAATPRGLHFVGVALADELFSGNGPAATAIGGTQEVSLEIERLGGGRVALDLPYDTDDDGGLGVTVVGHAGPVVTVKGARSRSNYLRILDKQTGELFDRYTLTGAALKSMHIVGTEFESLPSNRPELVFAPGDQTIGIALTGDVQENGGNTTERIVDTSMILDLAGATRASWDSVRITNAQPGMYPLVVTAGDKPAAQMPIEVVAGADAISVIGAQPTVPANSHATVCFQATNNHRYVYGLTWTFTANGMTRVNGKSDILRNCVSVSSEGMATGSLPVTATAGGQTIAINVLIAQSARSLSDVAPSTAAPARSVASEGDRARL